MSKYDAKPPQCFDPSPGRPKRDDFYYELKQVKTRLSLALGFIESQLEEEDYTTVSAGLLRHLKKAYEEYYEMYFQAEGLPPWDRWDS